MNPPGSVVRIAFGGHEVAVRTNDNDVADALRATFRHMGGTGAADPVAEVVVRRAKIGYVGTSALGATARRTQPRDIIRWVRQEVLETLISARRDLLWMHGAAAAREGRAVMLPGRRGRGKSTLVTELCAAGWSFLTDDVLPLDPVTLCVIPFPRVPEVRDDPGREMHSDWLLEVSKSEIAIDDRIEKRAIPVAAIVLPFASRAEGISFTPCAPSEAVIEMAEGCWNFADHGAAGAATLSRIVTAAPAARLRFRSGREAAARIGEWASSGWRAL